MVQPYLHLPDPGPTAPERHALFVARIAHWPFADLLRAAWDDWGNPPQLHILARQLHFLNALHPGQTASRERPSWEIDRRHTVELRYLRRPGEAVIECALLGKACGPDVESARANALEWWHALADLFPTGYALIPAEDPEQFSKWSGEDIIVKVNASTVAEIRRPVEMVLWTDNRLPSRHFPLIHPFAFQPEGWEAVWAAQMRVNAPTLTAVSLRPVTLPVTDELALAEVFDDILINLVRSRPSLFLRLREAANYYHLYLRPQPGLYVVRVHVIGPPAVRLAVRGALSAPVWPHHPFTGQADVTAPPPDELATVLNNLAWLEQTPWEGSNLPPLFEGLRYRVDAANALCAFRLPLLAARDMSGIKLGQEIPPDVRPLQS